MSNVTIEFEPKLVVATGDEDYTYSGDAEFQVSDGHLIIATSDGVLKGAHAPGRWTAVYRS